MVYYNQRNYKHIPYPSQALPNATVASGGCGVCSASMVIENLLKCPFAPQKSAEFSIKNGGRVNGGTDMSKLSKALCCSFPLKFSVSSDIKTVASKVKNGAMAIAHAKGGTKGLFSTSGHFVVLAEYKDGIFTVLDPYLYNGKYNTEYRRNKATLKGNYLYVSTDNVACDCTKYYIFERNEKAMTVEEAKQIIKNKAGLSDGTINFLYAYRFGDDLLIKLAKAMQ